MKNPDRVTELLAELKAECEYRFEFDAVAALAATLSELARVTVIDERHQEFCDKIYTKQSDGHFVRGSGNPLHRVVWQYYFGDIPKGFVIHHIDHDKNNNNIENLRLLTKEQHSIIHRKGLTVNKRISGICANCGHPFYAYENGRNKFCSRKCACAFHYKQNLVSRTCALCGKVFFTNRYGKAKCCSNSCAQKYRGREHQETKICPVCGEKFTKVKNSKKRFCSKSCASKAYWMQKKD